MFICGSKSLRSARQDEDDNESCDSPCRTPKRSRLAGFLRSTNANRDKISKSNNNPYAERGLDKFYQLVAENKDKTQKIYAAELGSKDISLVRFVYGNDSNDVRPIVIRNRDKNSQLNNSSPRDSTNTNDLKEIPWRNEVVDDEKKNKKIKKRRVRCNVNSFWLDNDFAVILVWILLLLAMSGRVFAILCTSIGWYMMATIVPPVSSSSLASGRKLKRKKEHVKKLSGDEETVVHNSKGSSSPKSVLTTYKSTAACA